MRCLKCQTDGIPLNATVCPNVECSVVFSSLFRDILPHGTLLHSQIYQIEYALGRGGFGVTYRATHRGLNRMVAIKEYYPQTYAMRGIQKYAPHERPDYSLQIQPDKQSIFNLERIRFIQEGHVLASLNHPGVVNVFDLFMEWNTAYVVMELLRGQTLRQRLDQQPGRKLPRDQITNIVKQLVCALEYLHKNAIYHLDIKPDNVFLTTDAQGQERAVLIDFGAARQGTRSEYTAQFDQEYAPPEIVMGKGEVGPGSDLYELGMMIYELMTGERLPNALQRMIGQDWHVIAVEEPWRGLLTSALHRTLDQRPADVREWWERYMLSPELYTFMRANRSAFPDPEVAREALGQTQIQMSNNQSVLQSQIASLQDQLKTYEQMLDQKQKDLESRERKLTRIQNQLDQKEKEIESGKHERSRIQSQLDQKEKELEKQSEELEIKEYSIYDKKLRIEDLEAKIEELEHDNKKSAQNDEQIRNLQNKINNAEKERNDLQQQVKDLTRRRDELKQKLDRVNQKVLLLEEEVENKTIDLIVKEWENDDDATRALQKTIEGMRGRIRKLENALSRERGENTLLQNEIDMLRQELQETQARQGHSNGNHPRHSAATKASKKPPVRPSQDRNNGPAKKRRVSR